MTKISIIFAAIVISFSQFASASNLGLYTTVINSPKLAQALRELESSEDASFLIEKIERTATYRCRGCFALKAELHGVPNDGREILILKTLKIMTQINVQNKLEVTTIEEVND
jgi:hypothetical protein